MARTTTDPENWRFEFTITDVARLLGKSPVTLRGWEAQHLIEFPRGSDGDRRFDVAAVCAAAERALELGRISWRRARLVSAAMTLLEEIERANRCSGKT